MLAVMKSSGSQRLLVSPYTVLVTSLMASWEMIWERVMGILLIFLGEARMSGSMMCGCVFLYCRCAGNPMPTGVMLIVSQSGVVSVPFSLLCEWIVGVLFEFGDVASMTGSTMLGFSLLDLR